MSIDRCKDVNRIVTAQFNSSFEKITQEFPEENGIYAVSVRAASIQRGGELALAVYHALSNAGFSCLPVEANSYWDGQEAQTGMERAALKFRVDVGGVRGL